MIEGVEYNESELTVKYPCGSKLTLFGADNPDSLRGIALWGVVFDEYSQQPSNIFSEVISKSLAEHLGYAIWIGTPKGKNEFYRLYERGRQDVGWYAVLKTIDDTLTTERGETVENLGKALEDEKKLVDQGLMTKDEFRQEWYCSFDAALKGAYYADEMSKAREEKRIGVFPADRELLVHTVWDLGVSDSTAIGFYQRIGNELRKIDYYENAGFGLDHYISFVKNKNYVYGTHFAPHDIKVREFGSGKSRLEIARSLGLEFAIVPNVPVADGINAARLLFSRLWIHEIPCQRWLDAIVQYRAEWEDDKGKFKDKPLHDWTSHAADELRYAALVEKLMTNQREEKLYKQPEWESTSWLEG